MNINPAALEETCETLQRRLIRARQPEGCWQGRLSSSALSTAVAVFALSLLDRPRYLPLVRCGIDWLCETQNPDGGWGDTTLSRSNISTTMLCLSALSVAEESARTEQAAAKARSWLADSVGGLEPGLLIKALDRQYGNDRSFSAPILTMCVLAGQLGPAHQAWARIKPLPFELALCPDSLFKWLRLPVVSYALPALIAVGQAGFHHRKPTNPFIRVLRGLARGRTLRLLQNIQPENGGFLEATPLTAFVLMSLVSAGRADNIVATKAARFLVDSARGDGSWPIDTNLATWLTTLSVNALATASDFNRLVPRPQQAQIRQVLFESQYQHRHRYTGAAPGGWAWTNLPGAVPDADDTAGALIALTNLGPVDEPALRAAVAGLKWLVDLQNSDGGIPTFCRGWTALPFDRSTPEITAHALVAFGRWRELVPRAIKRSLDKAIRVALRYLSRAQSPKGCWVPLWFGNERAPNHENPTYGTARVLAGLLQLPAEFLGPYAAVLEKAVRWLLAAQNQDGGWGGAESVCPSIEETAVAVDALARLLTPPAVASQIGLHRPEPAGVEAAVSRGASWLIKNTHSGESTPPSPIGLYFARLWYYEDLYPLIFALSALQNVRKLFIRTGRSCGSR